MEKIDQGRITRRPYADAGLRAGKRAVFVILAAIALTFGLAAPMAQAAEPAAEGVTVVINDDMEIFTKCGESKSAQIGNWAWTITAKAQWNVHCSGATTIVSGWVTDHASDNECARVKASIAGVWKYSGRACPKGTTVDFSLRGGDIYDGDAHVYLYTEP